MKKPKVLMVDDSDVVLEAGRMVLEDHGFEVITADNPLSVAHLVLHEKPELVLLDVNMPTLSGDMVAKIMLSRPTGRKVRIILYSDLSENELEGRVRLAGVDGYIRKTNNEDEFVRQVRQWLPVEIQGTPG